MGIVPFPVASGANRLPPFVEFQYSAAQQSLPVHVIAYDQDGNLVDDNTSSVKGADYDGASCTGDPNGSFCNWATLVLSSGSNNIRRVQINGTVSNYFGIDDLKICRGECAPPEGEMEQSAEIKGFGNCGPEGVKEAFWGEFGKVNGKQEKLEVLEADSGEKLHIVCEKVDGVLGIDLLAFVLYYTQPDGQQWKVGMCPFEGGCNSSSFVHSGDSDGNDKPDCFIRTTWISRDHNKNDEFNAWTRTPEFFPESLIPYHSDLLDWATSTFEVNTRSLTKTSEKFEYLIGPPIPSHLCGSSEVNGDSFGREPVFHTPIDPPIGPETEAFFSSVGEWLALGAPHLVPMVEDTSKRCDFDGDGVCGENDRDILREYIGVCEGEAGFNRLADIDGNGCLTVVDEIALFGEGEPPIANAGEDQVLECSGSDGAKVTLDGLGSYDPDGDLLSYTWEGPFGSLEGEVVEVTLPLGVHTITLTVDDGNGGIDSDTVDVTVEDTTPPELRLTALPDTLWPPNHKMVPIKATVTATDVCDSDPDIALRSVVSNEPDNGKGDGNTVNDIQAADIGSYDLDFELRAERSGKGTGRVYTITYEATDAAGNTATAEGTVTVPRNQ